MMFPPSGSGSPPVFSAHHAALAAWAADGSLALWAESADPADPLRDVIVFRSGTLDEAKTDTFVGMYVNGLTLDYGERGRKAVRLLFDEAWKAKLVPAPVNVEFIE